MLAFEARLQSGVHLQNVLLNPQIDGLMQGPEGMRPETLGFALYFELMEKHPELFVGLFVFCMGRAQVAFHALLLKPEVLFGVRLKEIGQMDQEFAFLPGRIGAGQHALKMIDIVNQHPVLVVNLFGTGLEPFIPDYHGKTSSCLSSPTPVEAALGL